MSTGVETASEIRPSTSTSPKRSSLSSAAHRLGALAQQGAGRRSVAGRAARDAAGARALLGDRLRLAQGRGGAQRAAAVQDRDRRGGHPLHPRQVTARGRVAVDHDARLARLGHRAAGHSRPAHRPDRARRTGGDAFDLVLPSLPGYGFSAEPTEIGWDPGRVAAAWAELMNRLGYTLRRPGRRRGGPRHRRDGPPGARGAGRNPHEPARAALAIADQLPAESEKERAALGALATFRESGWLLPGAGHPAADDRLLLARFTRWPRGLDARPRHGQLLQDLPRLPRRAAGGQSHPGPDRRQHHAVLADRHRRFGGPGVLGERTSPNSCGRTGTSGGFDPGRLHPFPGEVVRPRAAGPKQSTPPSPTSTRSTGAATSRPGRSPTFLRRSSRAAFRSLR